MANPDEMSEDELLSCLELDQQARATLNEAVSIEDLDAFPFEKITEIGQVAETLRDEQSDEQQQTSDGNVQPNPNPNDNSDQLQFEFLLASNNAQCATEPKYHAMMQTQRFADPQRGQNPDDQLPDYNSNTNNIQQQLCVATGSVELENQIMQIEQPNDDQQQIHDLVDQSDPNLNDDDDQLEMPFLDRQIPSPVAVADQQQQAQNASFQAGFNPNVNNVQQLHSNSFAASNSVTAAPAIAWQHHQQAEANNAVPASSHSHLPKSLSSTLNGSDLARQNSLPQQQPILKNFIPMSGQAASSSTQNVYDSAIFNEQGPSNSYLANTNPIEQSSTLSLPSMEMENATAQPKDVEQQNSMPSNSNTKKMPKKRGTSLQKNSTSVKIMKTAASTSSLQVEGTSTSFSPKLLQSSMLLCSLCEADDFWIKLDSCSHIYHQDCIEEYRNHGGKECPDCIIDNLAQCKSCHRMGDKKTLDQKKIGAKGVCGACRQRFFRLTDEKWPGCERECDYNKDCEPIEVIVENERYKDCCEWNFFTKPEIGFEWNERMQAERQRKRENMAKKKSAQNAKDQWPECNEKCDPKEAIKIKEELELLYEGKMCCLLASFKLFGFDRKPAKKPTKPRKQTVKQQPKQQKPIRARSIKPKLKVKQPKERTPKPAEQQKQKEILTRKSKETLTIVELGTEFNKFHICENPHGLDADLHGITDTKETTTKDVQIKITDEFGKEDDKKLEKEIDLNLTAIKQMLAAHAEKKGMDGDWLDTNGPPLGVAQKIQITKGINIWPEPFVDNDNHTVILLMETERFCDNNASEQKNQILFVFSLLMASTTVLSVSSLHELEAFTIPLNFFVEFAHLVNKYPSKIFEDLYIVMRDWEHQNEFPFGAVKDADHKKFSTWSENAYPGLVEKWSDVKDLFSKWKLFLMPSPGHIVKASKSQVFDLDDIANDFLNQMRVLVENIFGSVDGIHPIKCDGQPMTCRDLLEEMEIHAKEFNKDGAFLPALLLHIYDNQIATETVVAFKGMAIEEVVRKKAKNKRDPKHDIDMKKTVPILSRANEYKHKIDEMKKAAKKRRQSSKKHFELQKLIAQSQLDFIAQMEEAMNELNEGSMEHHDLQILITQMQNEYKSNEQYLEMLRGMHEFYSKCSIL